MTESIYIIDPITKSPVKVDAIGFAEAGIKERQDLEQWVIKKPNMLGEDLLIITSEFNRFDKSNRRLDLLALDAEGTLVVIELKLDVSGSLADLQAIRYAALCSTMTIEDVVHLFVSSTESSEEEAIQTILQFLHSEELPELGDRPRIIIAAGSVDDQELTSTVLWLRNFAVDISCVELTPYRIPDSGQIVLVPKIIIPVPEAREYIINVEIKKSKGAQKEKVQNEYRGFWKLVSEEFNKLDTDLHSPDSGYSGTYMKLGIRQKGIHYEWYLRRLENRVDASLHFEFDDRDESIRWLELIKPHTQEITRGIDLDFTAEPWGKRWAEVRFRIPYEGTFPNKDVAPQAARVMRDLVDRTLPILRPHFTG
jgi:hypothetical protein